MRNMSIKKNFENIHAELEPFVSLSSLDNDNDLYQGVIIAAFAKSFEFNLFLQRNRSNKNSFFFTPFLRGLCEDLITLKYLEKHFANNKTGLVANYMKY